MERRISFKGADCRLSAVEFGDETGPPMVILHGMRDHALSMRSIALAFPAHHVVALDLRGHGDSDNPGSYSMTQLVADVRALVQYLHLSRPVIIGHSLGGHIAARYTGIYPGEVSALILIDGMGPPKQQQSDKALLQQWRSQIDTVLTMSGEPRSMASNEVALQRLLKNNPRLNIETAKLIVEHGTEDHPEGGVCWKWDARINMVWGTFSHDESEHLYTLIECPVLMITGEYALDYWVLNRQELAGQHDLHAADLERRRKLFKQADHQVIKDAGHMLHYDQPDLLNQSIHRFLESID